MSRYVLAIDLGTSGLKVAVVDDQGVVRAAAYEPLVTRHTPDGGAEQDAEEWWQALGRAARRAVAVAGAAVPVDVIAVTAQYMSVVAVDEHGVPVAPVVMWTDRRGTPVHPLLARHDLWGRWLDVHGLIPLPDDDIGHVTVLRAVHPEHVTRVASYVEPADAVTARLTGRVTSTPNTAFPLMCTDNRVWDDVHYDEELVTFTGVERALLPPIVDPGTPLGPLTAGAAEHLGLGPTTIVMPATVDSITSAIGSGAIDSSRAALVVGTTSVLATHLDHKAHDLGRAVTTMPSPVPGQWFVMAENGVGGKALEVFVDGIVYADDALAIAPEPADAYTRCEAVAASVPAGAHGVQFLPWLHGSLAPAPNDDVRGGFLGMALSTTRADLARAVYEGVALNAAWLVPAVSDMTGVQYRDLTLGGGAARSRLLAEILASACGVTVHRLDAPEHTNARGAALLALAQLGDIDLAAVPSMVKVADTHEPDAAAADVYRAALQRHIALHG
ncbi:MAG TPA: FGGY family carbohydrate kinase, partial [Acidimicrobiia bacterium]